MNSIEYWKKRYRANPANSGAGSIGDYMIAKANFVKRNIGFAQASVLDFGCGNRNVQERLAALWAPGDDHRPSFTSYDPATRWNVEPDAGDEFEVVLALEVLEHILSRVELEETCLKLWQWVSPPGRLFVTCPLHLSGGPHIMLSAWTLAAPLLHAPSGVRVVDSEIFGSAKRQTLILCLEKR